MKRMTFIFLFLLFYIQTVFVLAEISPASVTRIESASPSKIPDFSPPKDLTGPVFPPEVLIGEPTPETNRFLTEFVNMMATLGLIISLLLIVAWFLKRMMNTRQELANTTSLIKVIEKRALSPKTAIYLLEVEGKSVMISESQNGVTKLIDYNNSDLEEKKEIPSSFNKIFDQTLKPNLPPKS